MARLSTYLRSAEGDRMMFWCPGCKTHHCIKYGTDGWGWNGDVNKPTFHPSVLVRSGHYASHHKPGDSCWCSHNKEYPEQKLRFTCNVCHSFIRDGKIMFLNDCTHALAGKTIDMVPIPESDD